MTILYAEDDSMTVMEVQEKLENNGYEVIVPKFKFYNFSDKTRFAPLYYAGEEELTSDKEFAKEVEEDSEEYVALKLLGFIKEEV